MFDVDESNLPSTVDENDTPSVELSPELVKDFAKLEKSIRAHHNKQLSDYFSFGGQAAAIKEKLPHGEFTRWVESRNARHKETEGQDGFEEGLATLENWMNLNWLWHNEFEFYTSNQHRGATYLWSAGRWAKRGKSLDEFVYTSKKHSGRTERIEHALDELDDIGLSELAPAIIEGVKDMMLDAYNQHAVDVAGDEASVTDENVQASVAQEILDRLNRRIEHIKNNSQWQEPLTQVTQVRELANAFEVLFDQVLNTRIEPTHKIRLSISVHKDKPND